MNFLARSIVLFNSIALFMPKRLSKLEIYSTALFSGVLQLLTDFAFISVYGFYSYFNKLADLRTLLITFGIFPALNTIYLNFFPFSRGNRSKGLYILGWSVFAILFELRCIRHGVFIYRNWKSWYSALLYPLVFLLLIGNLFFLQKLKRY